jgi:hypothetical protein
MTGVRDFLSALADAGKEHLALGEGGWRAFVAPGLAGRVWIAAGERVLHRFDAAKVRAPSRELGVYNNYGGLNVWPAPEGGRYGWAYTTSGRWHVQDGVNVAPFRVLEAAKSRAVLERTSAIVNRAGTELIVTMRREVELRIEGPAACTLVLTDVFACPPSHDALIAPWTLEQFDAHDGTTSFCVAGDPPGALNFDYYEHPGERIVYRPGYLLYRTDGKKAGQVGVRRDAFPAAIGMLDGRDGFLVVRRVASDSRGLTYFNIADNEQPRGPFSAADVYSIYNSPPELGFLELETIGGCRGEPGGRVPHELVSESTYVLGAPGALVQSVRDRLGVEFAV